MNRARRFLVLLALAAAPIGLLACGGDDDDGGDGGEAKREIQADAQDRAETISLERSDFPSGWTATPAEQEDDAEGDEFRQCLGLDGSDLTIVGEDQSDEFSTGRATQASSEATIFESTENAQDAMAKLTEAMDGGQAEQCFSDFIERAVAESEDAGKVEIGEIEVAELNVTAPEVEESGAWQVTVPIETQGQSAEVFVDLSALREGDAVVTLQTEDIVQAFDQRVRDQLLELLAGRMTGVEAAV